MYIYAFVNKLKAYFIMYLLDQQELCILYLMWACLNKCHQIKRIALEYI